MVKAVITFKSGGAETIYCNDFPELFIQLQGYGEYKKINAHEIEAEDMRQGRCHE